MINHTIRKVLALTALYCLIILGIFVIQFRNELIINKNIGNIRVTLHETTNQNQESVLENNFQIVYKSACLFADPQHPVREVLSDGTETEAQIESYAVDSPVVADSHAENEPQTAHDGKTADTNEHSFTLTFKSGSKLNFMQSGADEAESFTVTAYPAEGVAQIILSAKPGAGYKADVTTKPGSVLLNSDHAQYAVVAPLSADNAALALSAQEPSARVSLYNPAAEVTYANIAALQANPSQAFDSFVKQFRTQFVSSFVNHFSASSGEKEVAAYIAESAANGRFSNAVRTVQNVFKSESKRTYVSVPYLGGLVAMNRTMVSYSNNLVFKAQQAVQKKSLDAFEVDQLLPFLYYKNNFALIQQVLSLPSLCFNEKFEPTVLQTAGMLNAFCDAQKLDGVSSESLKPIMPHLLEYVLSLVEFRDSAVAFGEKAGTVSQLEAVRLGVALVRYGKLVSDGDIANTGYVLANAALQATPLGDIKTYADLYPVLVENTAYPHLIQLPRTATNTVTAWTCADDITITSPERTKLEIRIKFPVGESHYMIFTGIKPFNAIEMYGLNYRSDPQFEIYNSPGYIYDFATQTLFVKMRHKAEYEKVVLTYSEQTATAAGATGPQ